jgi:cytochrome c-type biogenesis protein
VNGLVYSASLMAAFLGGMLALFAPCCVVTLLPSFVAASLQRGLLSLPSTALLFSAGLAVILLPILLGIGALGQLIGRYHTFVFIAVGMFLMVLGVYILTGKRWTLPIPMMTSVASRGHTDATSTFFLGMASGIASSCCAPVMAGVVAMSALSASWVGALGLGLSYILGMVFPLLLFAIAAHRRGERRQRTPRRVNVLGTELLWTDALSGSMFLVFGGLTALLGISGESTITPGPLANWDRWITQQVGAVRRRPGEAPRGATGGAHHRGRRACHHSAVARRPGCRAGRSR